MPDPTPTDPAPHVPPRLVISSHPANEVANTSPGHRRSGTQRRKDSLSGEASRQTSSEWTDIDESPPRRRRRRNKRTTPRQDQSLRSSAVDRTTSGNELGRLFPRLSRILEASSETPSSPRNSTRGSETRRQRDRDQTRGSRYRDDISVSSSVSRRPYKHRTGGVSRRTESVLRVNPSLLSVLTSLTGNSDKSSGSNSTLTQFSYDRRSSSNSSRTPTGRPRRSYLETASAMNDRSSRPNVFDYMMPESEDGHDARSVASAVSSSPSTSHYEPSDAGSSDAPGTPSSRSTFPSPSATSTRGQSVAELRRKYDPSYTSPSSSIRSTSRSPEGARVQPVVSDVAEDDGVDDDEEDEPERGVRPIAAAEVSYGARDRSASRPSSRMSQHSTDRLRQQEESLHQHTMASAAPYPPYQQQPGHYVDPVYSQRRSASASSSVHSDQAYAHNMAMQQYQWPHLPARAPILPHNESDHLSQRPPAPDPPDPGQRTIAGYELLALELASASSLIKPLYRKFAYLNHRILLHLQDELAELEDQLRHLDEIIAQIDQPHSHFEAGGTASGQRTPASRRSEAWHGTELHHRRRMLLGNIFMKTEQYNRAMAAYSSMARDAPLAGDDEVRIYQEWMEKHAPIHKMETGFLLRSGDLIAPGSKRANTTADGRSSNEFNNNNKHTATLLYLPLVLMLPLLLFSIIPTLGGRLVVTALIAVGAFMVAATTRVRHVLEAREWAVCGAAYVLVMAAIAGCIPQHYA